MQNLQIMALSAALLARESDMPTPAQHETRWNGAKHFRSMDAKKPAGHAAKRKKKSKLQRAARKSAK